MDKRDEILEPLKEEGKNTGPDAVGPNPPVESESQLQSLAEQSARERQGGPEDESAKGKAPQQAQEEGDATAAATSEAVKIESAKTADIANGAISPSPVGRILIVVKDKLVEKSPEIILKPKAKLKRASRRDFLVYGGGMAALSAGFWWLLPDESKAGLGFASTEDAFKRKLLNETLSFDDLIGQGLFSQSRLVPTYSKSQMTEVPNNYAGQTPDEDIIGKWELHLKGLANNRETVFSSAELMKEFPYHEQITRLVCVEGWSAISGWGGFRFADLIRRYPPRSDCKWIQLRSDVNLDGDGNLDPYFVSFDLRSAMHPQTLLATHHNGKPLELEHGAPLRLLAPMKLGLKNIKAVTSIVYSPNEPDDYWNQNGYSYYDGI